MKLANFFARAFCRLRFWTALHIALLLFLPLSSHGYPWPVEEDERRLFSLGAQGSWILNPMQMHGVVRSELFYRRSLVDVDIGWEYDLLDRKHYVRPSALHLRFPLPFSDPQKGALLVGVKDHVWSASERYWDYGLFQPRFRLDPLRPKQMGLPGVYGTYKGFSDFLVFFSMFSLPDLGIRPDIVNGSPISKNPFFKLPFRTEYLQWDLKKLQPFHLSRKMIQPSIAWQMRYKLSLVHFLLSYAYKTSPKPLYAALAAPLVKDMVKDPALPDSDKEDAPPSSLPEKEDAASSSPPQIDLSDTALESDKKKSLFTGALTGEQRAAPSFRITDLDYNLGRHHLTALEARVFPLSPLSLTGALIYEKPEPSSWPKGWIFKDRDSHLTTSILLRLEDQTGGSQAAAVLGYSNVFHVSRRRQSGALDIFLKDLESFFAKGHDWKNAVSASLIYKTEDFFKGSHIKARLNYSLESGFYQASFESSVFLHSHLQASLSGDLFFRFSPKSVSFSAAPALRYKNLSRIMLGAGYVF